MVPLKVGVCQMTSGEDHDSNFEHINRLLDQTPDGTDLVVFPENSTFIKVSPNVGPSKGAIELSDPRLAALNVKVHELGMAVLLGGMPLKDSDGQIYNSVVFMDGTSEDLVSPQVVYRKMHLFDVQVGDKVIRESETYRPGQKPAVLEFKGWKIGLSVCYDLRFSELYSVYAKQAVDILFIPAAFLVKTGMAHWEVLMRARAIESQCFVVAPGQVGQHFSKCGQHSRWSYGHSMVVSPWGVVLLDMQRQEPRVNVIELDHDLIAQTRTQIPMANHRKL